MTALPTDEAPLDPALEPGAEFGSDFGAATDVDEAAGVVVRLSGARYALPMTAVAEVGRVPHITRVPGVPPWVAGVSNWRGRILPVIDLRPLLGGQGGGSVNDNARILVAGDEVISIGLLVEGVDGVAVPPEGELDPAPATVGPDAAELLAGQWSDESGPIGMIDIAALLRLRSRLSTVRRGA